MTPNEPASGAPRAISWSVLFLLASVSALLAYEYFLHVEEHQFEQRVAMHRGIVDGGASSQYRHRILAPYLACSSTGARSCFRSHLSTLC